MKISEEKKGDVVCLCLSERLDSVTAPDFENKLNGLIGQGLKKIIVNFSALEYISSAGLRVLLVATKKLKETNGKFLICSLQGMVKEVFKMSGFIEILPVFDTEQEAFKNV